MQETDHGFFWHPENLSSGKGRILYAKGSTGCDGVWRPEGWCLPGGERTTNRQRAFAVAVEIDRLTNEELGFLNQAIVGRAEADRKN